MKNIQLIIAGFVLFLGTSTQAQVNVNVNIGAHPAWGPVGFSTAEYYYIPDIESYYDIRLSQFIYFNNGKWVRSKNLPKAYKNYDLYHAHKVVLNDYHGKTPYVNFKNHTVKYYKEYKGQPQKLIGQKQENHKYVKNYKYTKSKKNRF